MDQIRIDVTGARQVGLRFDEFPDDLYQDLRGEIEGLTQELLGRVLAGTPNKTGKLHSEVRERLFTDENRITGYVDIAGEGPSDFAKAGALEYGSRGQSSQVAAHSMRLDHYWSTKLSAPETVLVQAFNRTPDVPEYAFERGPLETMQPEIIARLNAVVERRVAEMNA